MFSKPRNWLKSLLQFNKEFGLQRSYGHFITAFIISFCAGLLHEVLSGDWRSKVYAVIEGLFPIEIFISVMLVSMVLALLTWIQKQGKFQKWFKLGTFWAARLCTDLGAVVIGTMFGLLPITWVTSYVNIQDVLSSTLHVMFMVFLALISAYISWCKVSMHQFER